MILSIPERRRLWMSKSRKNHKFAYIVLSKSIIESIQLVFRLQLPEPVELDGPRENRVGFGRGTPIN
jgi:hypothetical protein